MVFVLTTTQGYAAHRAPVDVYASRADDVRDEGQRLDARLLVTSSAVAKALLVRCEALSNGAKLCDPNIVLVMVVTDQARYFYSK